MAEASTSPVVTIRVRYRRGAALDEIAAEHGLPPGAVRLVARPSRWGSPFDHRELGRPEAVRRYEERLRAMDPAERADLLAPLRGAGALACYCPPGEPCHADVLIRLLDQDGMDEDPSSGPILDRRLDAGDPGSVDVGERRGKGR